MKRFATLLFTCCSLCLMQGTATRAQSAGSAPGTPPITPYSASYELFYKGRRAGMSEFSVSRNAESDTWRFVSNSRLRGIVGRLVAPRPVIEDSRFVLERGEIRPAVFHYEDGSRKGDDNYEIAFDWSAGTAQLTTGNGPREVVLEPGILDRGTSQVAAMLDAARGTTPETYRIIDDDGLEVYEVTALGPATTTTGIGEIETVRFSQQRIGSSRSTVLWTAPGLHHLPVRIEQIRDGEAQTVFVLESVEFQ